jgi:NAD(P)-dependent dehydrogenase (short-subunit alcohol dehydrogenase family)
VSLRVFVTGGASGLGRAIATRFARSGARVAIGDRDEPGGETVARALPTVGAAEAVFLRCDVTRDEDLDDACRTLEDRWGGVDVVVNNAGVALAGGIDVVSLDDWRWIVDINLLGVVRGCRAFTPLFKRQRRGHFVNVASMAGLLDVPFMSAYNATKAAVVSISETLQNELRDDAIDVTVVCPSFFQTNIAANMRAQDPAFRAVTQKLLARSRLTADDVADDVFQGVLEKQFYVLSHKDGRAAWMMKRLLPRRLYASVLRRQTKAMRRAGGSSF